MAGFFDTVRERVAERPAETGLEGMIGPSEAHLDLDMGPVLDVREKHLDLDFSSQLAAPDLRPDLDMGPVLEAREKVKQGARDLVAASRMELDASYLDDRTMRVREMRDAERLKEQAYVGLAHGPAEEARAAVDRLAAGTWFDDARHAQARVKLGQGLQETQQAPEPAVSDSVSDYEPTPLGNFIGRDREMEGVAAKLMTSGQQLWTPLGQPVIESNNGLLAPANPLMSEEARLERIEAMVGHAATKFPGQPLRFDGNAKFVGAAIDAAIARGLLVEVSEKHRDLLLEKEAGLARRITSQGEAINTPPLSEGRGQEVAPGVEGAVAPSRAGIEMSRVTGRLVDVSPIVAEDGTRTLTIKRMGQDVQVKIDARHFSEAQAQALKGKTVRYEPRMRGEPPKVVNLTQERKRQQSAQREISR
ncbi:MAG: hypothetical protein M0T84_07065 [Betaproteobacteria bacterium]|nr:hypothetical protein [Betaproteobacteria bacterium]